MTAIAGEIVTREIADIGTLTFENSNAGEWLTARGLPAKKPRRRYLLGEDELDSVSSITGTLSKPALTDWAEDHGARGGAKAALMGEVTEQTPEEEIIGRVHALGLGAAAIRDAGVARGLATHSAFELLAEGEDVDPADYPMEWRLWIAGAKRAWLALGVTEVVASEEIVCHPEHGYAGRPDLVAVADGSLTLIDYKTGKGKVYDSAHYQARLYDLGLRRCAVAEVERIVIVGIDDVGGFQLVDCEASEADALDLLSVYRSRKRIAAGMAAQRKAIKKAAA